MIVHGPEAQLSQLLALLAENLDIPLELDRRLTAAYEDLGAFLKQDAEELFRASAEVYPQGSRRLGTLVRPVEEDADYDVDLVYRRDVARTSVTQQQLKESAGEQLKRYVQRKRKLDPANAPSLREGGRCWTLEYDGFHLDILPAIRDDEDLVPDGILITDRDLHRWQHSNPRGYARWFRNRTDFDVERVKLAKSLGVTVEAVPKNRVRTPLHRVVQLLKRHRDLVFAADDDVRPASILITTLAAHAYERQPDVESAMRGVLERIEHGIRREGGKWWVANPADPRENFADRWNEDRAKAFSAWLVRVKDELGDLRRARGLDEVTTVLAKSFGKTASTNAMTKLGQQALEQRERGTLFVTSTSTLSDRGTVAVPPHRFYGSRSTSRRR